MAEKLTRLVLEAESIDEIFVRVEKSIDQMIEHIRSGRSVWYINADLPLALKKEQANG